MTSPGLKRALDFEIPSHSCGPSGTSPTMGPVANGNKRRCTNLQQQSRTDIPGMHNISPFKDASSFLNPLKDDIASKIEEEMQKNHDSHCNGSDTFVLTARQTHSICERLVKEREQKLRDEYDRILSCKLAEQYDLLTKVNYLNSYVEPRLQTALTPPSSNPSMNVFAAAFNTIQRSAASAANSATSIPDLSSFAASLSANGHPSALTTSHHHLAYNLQQQAAAAAIQAQQRTSVTNNQTIPSGPVLLASNLDEQLATPEALFTLFGVFGDVIRVKILFNKKDNALVQMADSSQAQVAQGYLDKQKVFGKIVRVTRSKHQLVQMPRDGNQSDAGLTKDFTNSPLHRFKFPGSRNYMNIYPPSNTLHISNIPANIDEDDIHKAFKKACGFDYSSFKFFPKDRKMALIKFNSIEHATIALIKMHNFQINEDNSLRVSFSKSTMQP